MKRLKKYIVLGLIGSLIIGAAVVGGLFGLFAREVVKDNPCIAQNLGVPAVTDGTTPSGSNLTVKSQPINAEQLQYATTIVEVAVSLGLPARAAEVAIMTAIQESTLSNIPYGDRDSIGLFQQRDAWGPRRVRMNPKKSSRMFYTGGRGGQPGLVDIEGWEALPRGKAAQAVQVSAFPDAYAAHEQEAIAIVTEIIGDETVVPTTGECEQASDDPIEAMVQAALGQVDSPLDGTSFGGESARIATFNVRGSNHTGNESAMSRMETQAALIRRLSPGVVGLQELRPDQRTRLMELLGDTYDIFPKNPVYGESQLSVNSIIWDTTQFEIDPDASRPTPMPFYFGGQRQDIPLVKLLHIGSGVSAYYFFTHDPAHAENARYRYLNAQSHAALTDRLTAAGNLVFGGGDLNQGVRLRDERNTTYQNVRENLSPCVMEASGNMLLGYSAMKGYGACSLKTAAELSSNPVDHVLVPAKGVEVSDYQFVTEGTASDHPLVYADVTFGGDGSTSIDGVSTSAELVSWAAGVAGIELPSKLSELAALDGVLESGVSAEYISADDIAGGRTLERGDLTLLSESSDKLTADQIGIYTGSNNGGTAFRASSWNLQVGPGYQARVDRALQAIKQYSLEVIGFQEVENKAMFNALAAKTGPGTRYAIYPENPEIVAHGWIGARPIIYDAVRFEKMPGSGKVSFPRMQLDHPEKQPVDFPLLRLKDRLTGQEIVVMNFHFAAFKRYAKERYESGKSVVEFVQEQVASGTPVVLTGDFNSNFFMRQDGPNPTFQGSRDNMAYCQFTRNGLMNNALDLAETAPRFAPGSYCPRTQEDGGDSVDHIYLSNQFDVPDGAVGEVTDTLSDHDTAPYADVVVLGATDINPGEPTLGTYVGASEDGKTVALRSLNPKRLVGAIRLTVAGPGLEPGSWVFPLAKGSYNYSSPYGPRNLGEDDFHNGADFGTNGVNAPLVAMHQGTVIRAQFDEAWGNYLMVETNIAVPEEPGATYKYMYAHLSEFEFGLLVNQTVEAGDPVGKVGDTGNSSGEHLHLNICTNLECLSGDPEGAIDPIPFLESVGITP